MEKKYISQMSYLLKHCLLDPFQCISSLENSKAEKSKPDLKHVKAVVSD